MKSAIDTVPSMSPHEVGHASEDLISNALARALAYRHRQEPSPNRCPYLAITQSCTCQERINERGSTMNIRARCISIRWQNRHRYLLSF